MPSHSRRIERFASASFSADEKFSSLLIVEECHFLVLKLRLSSMSPVVADILDVMDSVYLTTLLARFDFDDAKHHRDGTDSCLRLMTCGEWPLIIPSWRERTLAHEDTYVPAIGDLHRCHGAFCL